MANQHEDGKAHEIILNYINNYFKTNYHEVGWKTCIIKFGENLMKKINEKYKEIILYILFGGLTTLVNIITYGMFVHLLNVNYLISNMIAWIVSVLFAYVSNKVWVFESKALDSENIIKECSMFIGCRLFSGILDMLFMFSLIDIIHLNNFVAKIIVQILIVILNYIFSKLIIFRN